MDCMQHARLNCPSPTPGVCSNSLSFESVMPPNHLVLCCPLLLLPSIFPSIRVFPVSWLFVSGGQNIGASASASVLSTNIQGWFPLGWTVLISLQSNRLSRTFSNTTVHKHQFLVLSLLYGPTLTSVYDYWKNHSFDYTDLCKPSHVSRDRNGPPVLGAQSPSLWTKGKFTLWAFLRHILTSSEAGFFISLRLHPETFSLVQAYSSQKKFSLESAVSRSRMKFSTPFNFKPYHSFWEVTTWNMLVTCSSFVEKRSLIHWNWKWSVLVFRFVLLPRISLLMADSLCCAIETNTTL